MEMLLILLISNLYIVSCIPPPHPFVVAVRQEEELLPAHLRSTALHNPHLREILPLTSLLHKGEKPVYERAADTVPRKEIYNILTHAGLVPRKYPHTLPNQHRIPARVIHGFHDPPFLPTQDYRF